MRSSTPKLLLVQTLLLGTLESTVELCGHHDGFNGRRSDLVRLCWRAERNGVLGATSLQGWARLCTCVVIRLKVDTFGGLERICAARV